MKTKLFFFLFSLIIYSQALSQSIKITNVSEKELCIGYSYTVDYEVQGTFNSDNVFVAQLSYDQFQTFKIVGSTKSTISGRINITIPKDGPYITGKHRLRVISSNPYVIGSDNGEDLMVLAPPPKTFSFEERSPLWVVKKKLRFRLSSGTEPYFKDAFWSFGEGASIETYKGLIAPVIEYYTTGEKTIKCSLKLPISCASETELEYKIKVYDCSIKIESGAYIDSITKTIEYSKDLKDKYSQVWIMPGAVLTIKDLVKDMTFLIETGGQLTLSTTGRNCFFYLKPGASLITGSAPRQSLFFLTPGSSYSGMPDSNFSTSGDCSQLYVNYQNAPIEGIRILEKLGYLNVDNNYTGSTISISPNPAGEYIEISGLNKGLQPLVSEQEIKIFNLLGECVLSVAQTFPSVDSGQTGMSDLLRIDVSGLPAGVYFVRLGDWVGRFLKI